VNIICCCVKNYYNDIDFTLYYRDNLRTYHRNKNNDYCCYCYPNGSFNSPNETMEEMIESCIPHVLEAGTCPDAESARKMMQEFFPTLKRWKTA